MLTFARNKNHALGLFAGTILFIILALVIESGALNRSLPGGARQVWHIGGVFYLLTLFMLITAIWTWRSPMVVVDDAGIKLNLAPLRKPFVPFGQLQAIEVAADKFVLVRTKPGKKYKLPLKAFSPEGKQAFLSYVASRT